MLRIFVCFSSDIDCLSYQSLFFLSLKIVFFLTFRLAASSEGKRALFPLTKPQGETLGKKRFLAPFVFVTKKCPLKLLTLILGPAQNFAETQQNEKKVNFTQNSLPLETNESSHFRLQLSDQCAYKRPLERSSVIFCKTPLPSKRFFFLFISLGFSKLLRYPLTSCLTSFFHAKLIVARKQLILFVCLHAPDFL